MNKIRPSKANIAFIGGRGAGKSLLSGKFSELSGLPRFSIDLLISYESKGLSIEDIVRDEGWMGFREKEFFVLEKLSHMKGIIIDCGGGILVEAPNPSEERAPETFSERKAQLLQNCSEIVYVKRDREWLLGGENLRDSGRPRLGGAYQEILDRRLPWYESMADFILDMGQLNLKEATDLLMKRFSTRIKNERS